MAIQTETVDKGGGRVGGEVGDDVRVELSGKPSEGRTDSEQSRFETVRGFAENAQRNPLCRGLFR